MALGLTNSNVFGQGFFGFSLRRPAFSLDLPTQLQVPCFYPVQALNSLEINAPGAFPRCQVQSGLDKSRQDAIALGFSFGLALLMDNPYDIFYTHSQKDRH